ncbi:MAG: hypothetical protein QME74_11260, partial [Candidatus Edwardsbacteria bacterium]|nr:hypothetical protein [Candidatus Edwardsbacteria bacterium]
PWNPPLGRYQAIVSFLAGSDTLVDSTCLTVRARRPAAVPEGFCAMTIESAGNLLNNKTPSPYGNAPATAGWRNFTEYAKFLGADAVWYSVGWTIEGAHGITDKNPWVKSNFSVFPKLAEECHKNGLQFGGYVGSYLLWGPTLHKLKYDYSLEIKSGRIFRNHHVNLDDAKRREDISYILKLLEADPNVDFIGLDYIRPGAGGFETVEDFVKQMNIDQPKGWQRWPLPAKIAWVAKQVKPVSDRPIRERWQWWQAHRSATAVERLLRQAGVTKRVWGFTLGWEKGHQHGQDPCMMNDAGLDLDAVMLYESNAQQCREMTGQWSAYLDGSEAQLLPGEQIDWVLLQKSVSPPAPEEFYWRLTDAIKGTSNGGRVKGLFWHDMFRCFRGRRGPHGMREWLIAGAASFSKVRQELQCFPFSARLFTDNGALLLRIERTGTAGRTGALDRLTIEALTPQSPLTIREIALDPKTSDTAVALGPCPKYGLASYRITWGGAATRDQIVLFKYFPDTYAAQPFRAAQSFRTGGDVLIATGRGRASASAAAEIGRIVRAIGLVPNTLPLDSLFPDLRYKYPVLFVVADDSLTSQQSSAIRDWPTRPVMIARNANSGFDHLPQFAADSVRARIEERLGIAPRRPKAAEQTEVMRPNRLAILTNQAK